MSTTSTSSIGVTAGSLASANKPKQAGKKLGTLVVVIIKARNLPNKQRIGKQDPYCSVTIGHQKNKTPAVKRGGQTPHWDAQLQFEIWDDSEDKVSIVASNTGGIGPSSSLSKTSDDLLPGQAIVGRVKPKTSSGDASKRIMKIACYADDPREPELIGDTELDYTDTLKKGEFDEWVEIKHRGKYAGEVFMEMTFYSAAPPPVRRKHKPAIPGSGYGGPGRFEPLPASFAQSPDRPTSLTPASHLSPSTAQPLRMSQSQYGLSSSTSGRPTGVSPDIDEFGQRRPQSTTPGSFPVPSSTDPGSGYNPPYAPPALAHSASSSQLAKPHRSSFSSYGMTQHDIDSMLRPLSSLSIGSVNKPLPMPAPHTGGSQQAYLPPTSPARPVSTSGHAILLALQPSVSPHPLSHIPPPSPLPQPGLHHQHSYPVQQYPANEPYAGQHPPSHHHRHSMTTYLPDGSDIPWNASHLPHPSHSPAPPAIQHAPAQEIGLYNPPGNDTRPAYDRPQGTWQDPRGPSPYPDANRNSYHPPASPAYGLASPPQSAGFHPTALQPGNSPQFAQISSPLPTHSPAPPPNSAPITTYASPRPMYTAPYMQDAGQADAQPVWNNAAHMSSPVLGEPFRQDGHQNAYNDYAQQTTGQYHPEQQYPAQSHHNDQTTPYQAYQHDNQSYAPAQQQYTQPQSHQADYSQQQPPYQQPYDQNLNQQQGYEQPQQSGDYYQPTPPPAMQPSSHDTSSLPPPPGHYQPNDVRTSSPYRPLPQPNPPQSQSVHQQYQDHQDSQAHPPPRQPRFGLPPHQPYDPPYIPPSSRQSQHSYQSPQHHQYQQYADQQQAPPPIPPVPQELRQEQYGSYGYNSHRY